MASLQYSYNFWPEPESGQVAPEPATSETMPPQPTSETDIEAEEAGTFSFSKDLEELEAGLRMEAWPEKAWPEAANPPTPLHPDNEPDWGLIAAIIAEKVTEAMQAQTRPEDELAARRWQHAADGYLRDNRIMARQIRQMIEEKESLSKQLAAYELELARFRPLVGNLHLKF